MDLHFDPGEAAQVDFAHCGQIEVDGECRRLHAFVMTLCHSRMMYARFIMRENMEHFLWCHAEAFRGFEGVPARVIVDNCKVAVLEHRRHEKPLFNRRYKDMADHFGFDMHACAPRSPQEKGRVENGVGYIKKNFLNGKEIGSLEALNGDLRLWLDATANVRIHGATRKRPVDMFEAEKKSLKPLPLRPYDCSVTTTKPVNRKYRITFESNRYTVPPKLAGRKVELGVLPESIVVRRDGEVVARHARCYARNKDVVDPEHDKAMLQRGGRASVERLRGRFLALGDVAAAYYQGLKDTRLSPDTHVRKILALLDEHGEEETLRAMADSAEFRAFSSDFVANIIRARRRFQEEPGPLHLSRATKSHSLWSLLYKIPLSG